MLWDEHKCEDKNILEKDLLQQTVQRNEPVVSWNQPVTEEEGNETLTTDKRMTEQKTRVDKILKSIKYTQ